MSSVSTLPTELWLKILRSIYEISLSSDILLQDYPWVDTLCSKRYRDSVSGHHRAVVRSISQVCRTWKMIARQLRYQEIEVGTSAFSFHDLMEHQLSSSIFNETRRLNVTAAQSNNTHDLSLLVQSMPRLEWLQLSTHEIEETSLLPWLPSILGPRPRLLYLDLKPLHYMETTISSESISLISGLATRLRRLTCAIKYVARSDGQAYKAPVFEDLQVLQLMYICCDPGDEEAGREWFSRWRLPSLKQFHIPKNWEYCTELLGRGVGAQIEVLDASGHSDVPEQLWFLCSRVHTVITVRRPPIPPEPPEARPKLHYIFTYPFRKWTTNFDQIALASLLTSILSKWKEQGPSSREYTFSLRYTEVSWQAWAKLCEPSTTSRVQSALVRWKEFAEKHQVEVLDRYEVDIRDVAFRSEALEDSDNDI